MASFLAPFFRWKSNSESRLYFQSCEPTVLQDTRCEPRRISRSEVQRLNTTKDAGVRGQKCRVSEKRTYTKLFAFEGVRVPDRKKSGCNTSSEWSVPPYYKKVYVLRVNDNGAESNEIYCCPVPAADRVIRLDR